MLRFALRNLWTRPLRTLLSLCGLTVAIAGMVGLFSVAEGLESLVADTFGRIPGLVVMQAGAPIPLFSRLPADWKSDLEQLPGVYVVNPEVWARAQLVEGKPSISPPRLLFGTRIDTALKIRTGVYKQAIVAGRFLTPTDRGTFNAVISQPIAEQYHKQLGDSLRVDGHQLNIVGIYHCRSMLLDVAIIMDIDQVRSMTRMGNDSVCAFYVEQEPDADRERVVHDIENLLRGRSLAAANSASLMQLELARYAGAGSPAATMLTWLNGIAKTTGSTPANEGASNSSALDTDELPVEIRTSDDWSKEIQKLSEDLDIFLVLMTGIGVTIAVLSIVNTMLMSVTERFTEFGVLKANGWSNRDVLQLITWESAALGVAGGLFGVSFGWLATQAINANWPTRVHLYASPRLLLFSIVFSTALGMLGGLYPAMRAARLSPMEAIRRGG
ncbi:MAG: ABC transporter permease [Planctomycetales bacterium]|nr:ABC transporter permease [Planctomycetales bacterium]